MISVAATRKSKPIEMLRSRSFGRPSWSTIQVSASSETRKVVTRPAMIAKGRRWLPLAPPANTIGSTG